MGYCNGCEKFEENVPCYDDYRFCEKSLAEHNAKIRADAIEEFANALINDGKVSAMRVLKIKEQLRSRRMSKEDLKEVCSQITQFTVSWNSCSHKHIPYDAMNDLTRFLWEYFSVDFEEGAEE